MGANHATVMLWRWYDNGWGLKLLDKPVQGIVNSIQDVIKGVWYAKLHNIAKRTRRAFKVTCYIKNIEQDTWRSKKKYTLTFNGQN